MDYLQKKSIRSVAAAITGFLRHSVRKIGITREKLPSCIALAVCPLVTFYLFEMYTHNPFTTMHFKTQLLNMAFYVLTALLLFGIVKYVRAALMLQTAFFMVAGLANYYVLNFRSAPIMPWDIYSISTAASVAGNFSYELSTSTILVIVGFLILLLIESRFHMKAPGRVAKRAALILLSIVMIYGYTGMIQSESFVQSFGLYDKLFTPTVMNKRDGNIVAFLMEMEYLDVEKPADYSADGTGSNYEQAGKDSAGLAAAVEDPESVKRPNIIVIMDEAFSDLAVRGEFTTNEDYMPFIHSLQQGAENTRTGYLNVSVLGGNTANTEFEFLTGSTIGFLPQGSVAYQQYVQKEMPSLASYLKELDYHTVAIHPYYASGWDRDRVYPLLGFDKFYDYTNMIVPFVKMRNNATDQCTYDNITHDYEQQRKSTDAPYFGYTMTIQNHSSYDVPFDNFDDKRIVVENADAPDLGYYLSLIKYSDEMFENLINYYKNTNEPTVILLTGDHQPRIHDESMDSITNGEWRNWNDEEMMRRYEVPFLIWANYDIDKKIVEKTSMNYLQTILMETIDGELTGFQKFQQDLQKEIPVLTSNGYWGADGKFYSVDDKNSPYYDLIQEYAMLQYNDMTDYKNRVEDFFELKQ